MAREEIRGRFKDAPWFPKEEVDIVIGGAGGIGSWLSFLTARAGFNPIVYDFDLVESHNMGGQFFSRNHIGLKKVDALKIMVDAYSDADIMVIEDRFDTGSMSAQYMFGAFDNMQARKDMFEIWWRDNHDNPNAILIDGRLLMEQMQIFCVTVENAKEYAEKHLFNDSEVEKENCTMKQTSHSACMIASFMLGFFTNHYTNVLKEQIVRQVPFFHEYFIPLNLTS